MKKSVLRKVLIAVPAALAVLATVIATRPSEFHVERSITIAAPPERAFTQVDDFHAWSTWSPYEKLDPQMKRGYEGPSSGAGAIYTWSGNDKAGEGRMKIERSEAPSRIDIELQFQRPFECTNTASFTFTPTPEGTKVTWAMEGQNGFLAKAASLVFDMDKLVGDDFEKGLASLKLEVEEPATAKAQASATVR